MGFIHTINDWEGDEPAFHEFFFSTWITWLLLEAVYRRLFRISTDITPEYKLVFVQYFASISFVIDKYFRNAAFGQFLLYGYLVIVLIIFIYLLITPIFRYPYARYFLHDYMNAVCTVQHNMIYILYMYIDNSYQNVWPLICVDLSLD